MPNFDEYTVSILDKRGRTAHRGQLMSRTGEMLFIKGNNLPMLPRGSLIKLILQHPLYGVKYIEAEVGVASDAQLNVAIKSESPFTERRSSLKVPTDLKCSINSLVRKEEEIPLDNPVNFNVLNISLGGMLISPDTDFRFEVGDKGFYIFEPYPDNSLPLVFKVIRVDKVGDKISYGCCFEGIMPTDEDILCRYIYERQLALRNSSLSG